MAFEYSGFGMSRVRFMRVIVATTGVNLHEAKRITDAVWAFHSLDVDERIQRQMLWKGLRLAGLIARMPDK